MKYKEFHFWKVSGNRKRRFTYGICGKYTERTNSRLMNEKASDDSHRTHVSEASLAEL